MEIVNFAVEDYPNGRFLIRHGLVPARKVDDGEPPETKAKWPLDVIALIIGTPVSNSPVHGFDAAALNGRQTLKVVLSANAAHRCSNLLLSIPGVEKSRRRSRRLVCFAPGKEKRSDCEIPATAPSDASGRYPSQAEASGPGMSHQPFASGRKGP